MSKKRAKKDKIDKNRQTERKAYEKNYFCCGGFDFYGGGDKCEGNCTWKKGHKNRYYAKTIGRSENKEWEKHIKQLAAKKSSQLMNGLNEKRRIDKSKKLIAFSFDDGPARGNTDRVVKALENNHARATFLCLDRMLPIIHSLLKK